MTNFCRSTAHYQYASSVSPRAGTLATFDEITKPEIVLGIAMKKRNNSEDGSMTRSKKMVLEFQNIRS